MLSRRTLNTLLLTWAGLNVTQNFANGSQVINKTIPSSHTTIPAIGMGTWITFDVNQANKQQLDHLIAVLHAFFKGGGRMIDSSPMYGFAQQVLGQILPLVQGKEQLFSATKVWTMGQQNGIAQMHESMKLWGLDQIDLMYVHNMLDWQTQIKTLNDWKQQGLIKYTGITTSHGRRHQALIAMLKSTPVDFVQFSYNISDREAENYLLPLAQDLGVAVVINRPFQTGGLFTRVRNQPLPEWSKDIQCENWAQFFLKFVISHPAVTCAIPATSQVQHMQQNMQALQGDLPDQAMRLEMIKYHESVT
ncbi:aldo/keto reductase [Marinicella litoralis]|uniref:Diketogulonate reductase-like aldo/keto reductase n=1 Tax=Marinicella litoralis TaxID=644220 RepID=A0A4R6XY87_9GAMM|nr:aldo/keto reductase [Marinicella litoralis]TDR23599.1 diketogulonate reductase-like aldo/keto reductase [Marinicella litoralis]